MKMLRGYGPLDARRAAEADPWHRRLFRSYECEEVTDEVKTGNVPSVPKLPSLNEFLRANFSKRWQDRAVPILLSAIATEID